MIFTIDEIRNYLNSKKDLQSAIDCLSEKNITACTKYSKHLNTERTQESIKEYEVQIGIKKLKDEQIKLRASTHGKQGKYWMALSAKWIEDEEYKKDSKTEYEIYYWVNYGDNNTYGKFTVEQIMEWLTNPEIQLHELGGTKER